MNVFAVVSYNRGIMCALHSVQLFDSKELAQQQIQTIATERQHKLGVKVVKHTDTIFEFLLGWEEVHVLYTIIELPVSSNINTEGK